MARPRSKHFPEIKRTILRQAAEVFATIGYATSTIGDLTDATELSRGALYHYFPSKEAVLYEIISDQLTGFLKILNEAMQSTNVPVEKLRMVTAAIVECNVNSRNEQVVVLNEINQLSDDDRECLKGLERQIFHKIADLIVLLDTDGRVTAVNKSVYAMMYLGIVNYTFAWYRPTGVVKPAEYAELATTLFLRGLQG